MKKTILLMTIIVVAFLLVPILSFAQPEKYLNSESSSHCLAISKAAKQAALKTKVEEDNLMLYQSEKKEPDLENRSISDALDSNEDSGVEDAIVGNPDSSPSEPDPRDEDSGKRPNDGNDGY